MASRTEEQLGEVCLNVAEVLTKSKFGFIGEISPDGRLDDLVISNPGWETCSMANPIGHRIVPGGFEIHGLYARAKGKYILISNDPPSHPDSIGIPKGHPPLSLPRRPLEV